MEPPSVHPSSLPFAGAKAAFEALMNEGAGDGRWTGSPTRAGRRRAAPGLRVSWREAHPASAPTHV